MSNLGKHYGDTQTDQKINRSPYPTDLVDSQKFTRYPTSSSLLHERHHWAEATLSHTSTESRKLPSYSTILPNIAPPPNAKTKDIELFEHNYIFILQQRILNVCARVHFDLFLLHLYKKLCSYTPTKCVPSTSRLLKHSFNYCCWMVPLGACGNRSNFL